MSSNRPRLPSGIFPPAPSPRDGLPSAKFAGEEAMPKSRRLITFLLAAAGLAMVSPQTAFAAEPIKIGFGMGLTGGLAASGKAALLGMKIWEEETNAKGGLLGRPVQLIYYDDQSNPSTVPGIFTKLLDVDKIIWWSAITAPICWRRPCRS